MKFFALFMLPLLAGAASVESTVQLRQVPQELQGAVKSLLRRKKPQRKIAPVRRAGRSKPESGAGQLSAASPTFSPPAPTANKADIPSYVVDTRTDDDQSRQNSVPAMAPKAGKYSGYRAMSPTLSQPPVDEF